MYILEIGGDPHASLDLGFDCRRRNRLIAGAITHKGGSMNWIANIIAGLVGSSLGEALLGAWGPQVAGMAIVPSLLGAIILVILVSWIMTMLFGSKAHS